MNGIRKRGFNMLWVYIPLALFIAWNAGVAALICTGTLGSAFLRQWINASTR